MKYFRLTILTLTVCAVMHTAWADDTPTVSLEGMTIELAKKPKAQTGETTVTRRELNEANIQNSHDLVRYNTEVDVAEVGRYGNKGFAIRGVDGNRVAMSIDGVALPEAEVNEIFSPYGYMYEGRFNPDLEMMSKVNITAGADSLLSGSGAVGGSVAYSTKNPSDLVRGDKTLGGYAKLGYTNKNNEKLTAFGLAGVYDMTEFLINYSHREGNELKNHDMRKADKARLDSRYLFPASDMPYNSISPRYNGSTSSLIYPDPLHYKRDSALVKLYHHLNDSHRVGVHALYQEQKNHMNTDSKNVTSGARLATDGGARRAHDVEKMQSYGVNYQFTPLDGQWLDRFNVDYTHSKTLGVADTWHYNRVLASDETSVLSSKLFQRDYRPTETTIDQVSLKFKTLPFDFGRFGEHQFSIHTNYAKQDYTSTARYKYPDGSEALNLGFPDAKKDIYGISLMNNMRFHERIKAMIGVRYDSYKYSPYYQNTDEQKYIANICTNPYFAGEWVHEGLACQAYRAEAGLTETDSRKWRYDAPALQAWRDANYGKYTGLEKTKFDNITWGAGVDYEVLPSTLTARYKIGTGFLAPTVNQIYSTFSANGVHQIPNYNLKPEKSLNQELELDWQMTDDINLTVGGYLSKYKDFIHTKYWNYTRNSPYNNGCQNGTCLQSTNLDTAKVHGFKLGINANLSNYLNTQGTINVFANYHTAKDSATIETDKDGKFKVNTLAAVPTSLLLGGTYTSADDRWQLNGRMSYTQRKKASDVKQIHIGSQTIDGVRTTVPASSFYECYYMSGTWDGSQCYRMGRPTTTYYEYADSYDQINRSKSVMIYDVYGTAKLGKNKNWIVNAGVYNITNEKHIPWETLRQFANSSVNTMVDKDGHGFDRYTAPGRNYAVSLTYEF